MGKVIEFNPERATALEFFSGVGLARAGMERAGIRTIWANDFDETKCRLYRAQWGGEHLRCMDVFDVDPNLVPAADIAWASSPCTDLSLAGKREGLVNGTESSAFFGFVKVIEGLDERRPHALVLENVTGLASSHDGNDFRTVVVEFNRLGYSVDAFELDARRWLPQSRPRMFVVGLREPLGGGRLDSSARPDRLSWIHSDKSLVTHITKLPPIPHLRATGFTRLVETLDEPGVAWWDDVRVHSFIDSLSPVQRARYDALKKSDGIVARTAYRRTRCGRPVWEMRDDDIAGCLRTARGGSSKQAVVILGNGDVRIRWMTGREYAALQGAHDFALDDFRESQIQYGFGDAVAVPVVAWLMRAAVLPSLLALKREETLRVAV